MSHYLDRASVEVGSVPPQETTYEYGYRLGRSAGVYAARLIRYWLPHGMPAPTVMHGVFNGLEQGFRDNLGARLSP